MFIYKRSFTVVIPFAYTAAIFLSRPFGSQLGGTAIRILGPCFEPSDTVECSFGGISTPGIFVSQEDFICVSPAMDVIGRLDIIVTVKRGGITFQGRTTFFSSKSVFWQLLFLNSYNQFKLCNDWKQIRRPLTTWYIAVGLLKLSPF